MECSLQMLSDHRKEGGVEMIVAKRPCSFEGKKFFIGDEIPEAFVRDPDKMEKLGIVVIAGDGAPVELAEIVAQKAEVLFHIPILKGDELLEIDVSEPQIREAVKTMQMSVKDATAHIKEHVEDDTVLILLNAIDSRAAVKKEAELKAKEIVKAEESAGEA